MLLLGGRAPALGRLPLQVPNAKGSRPITSLAIWLSLNTHAAMVGISIMNALGMGGSMLWDIAVNTHSETRSWMGV